MTSLDQDFISAFPDMKEGIPGTEKSALAYRQTSLVQRTGMAQGASGTYGPSGANESTTGSCCLGGILRWEEFATSVGSK